MSKGTENHLYLVFAQAYAAAIEQGAEQISMHVDWIAEALEYLNPLNTATDKVSYPWDDLSAKDLRKALGDPPIQIQP